jgi:hypothetical protein
MATAMVYPEKSRAGRGNANSLETKEINSGVLSQCRKILRHLPAVADSVIARRMTFAEGCRLCQVEEGRIAAEAAKMHRLLVEAPHWLEEVRKEGLSFP